MAPPHPASATCRTGCPCGPHRSPHVPPKAVPVADEGPGASHVGTPYDTLRKLDLAGAIQETSVPVSHAGSLDPGGGHGKGHVTYDYWRGVLHAPYHDQLPQRVVRDYRKRASSATTATTGTAVRVGDGYNSGGSHTVAPYGTLKNLDLVGAMDKTTLPPAHIYWRGVPHGPHHDQSPPRVVRDDHVRRPRVTTATNAYGCTRSRTHW